MSIVFQKVSGPNLKPHIEDLAALRIEVFKEFPYLYEGSLDYELDYLDRYLRCERSFVGLAFDGKTLIGATTCLPMEDEDEEFRSPLVDAGYDITQIVYFGESIILKSHRGQGIGHKFFDFRHEHAQQCVENLKHTCFCAVIRAADHPARPQAYRPLDAFWQRQGYMRRDSIVAQFPWQDVGDKEETQKQLVYWIKDW